MKSTATKKKNVQIDAKFGYVRRRFDNHFENDNDDDVDGEVLIMILKFTTSRTTEKNKVRMVAKLQELCKNLYLSCSLVVVVAVTSQERTTRQQYVKRFVHLFLYRCRRHCRFQRRLQQNRHTNHLHVMSLHFSTICAYFLYLRTLQRFVPFMLLRRPCRCDILRKDKPSTIRTTNCGSNDRKVIAIKYICRITHLYILECIWLESRLVDNLC